MKTNYILFFLIVDGVRRLKRHFEEYITRELSKFLFQMKLVSHEHVIIDIDANEQCQFHIEQSTIVNTTSTNTTDNRKKIDNHIKINLRIFYLKVTNMMKKMIMMRNISLNLQQND